MAPAAPCKPAAGAWALVLAALALPACLVWDYAWECTIGIDLPWSPPHTVLVVVIAIATLAAAVTIQRAGESGVRLFRWEAPVGAWVVLLSAWAFVIAWWLDRWWQSGYGLAAGLWPPSQFLKALAFAGLLLGAWLGAPGSPGFAVTGAAWLAYLSALTIPSILANRQHSAAFYEIAAAAYPAALVAQARAGRATAAAAGYFLLWGALVWILPLFSAQPQLAPIFQPRDHLLPPPFPLLLILPAIAIDWLRRDRNFALEAGLAFFLLFIPAQWLFSSFLLSPAAANGFFAGGGREWPFFLQISPAARSTFWLSEGASLGLGHGLLTLALCLGSAQTGYWIGAWRAKTRP